MTALERKQMSDYEFVKGYGDNITCDNCWDSVDEWWSADHAICNKCHTQYQQELTPEKTINDIKREQEESNA